jgi:hypothetical protein
VVKETDHSSVFKPDYEKPAMPMQRAFHYFYIPGEWIKIKLLYV